MLRERTVAGARRYAKASPANLAWKSRICRYCRCLIMPVSRTGRRRESFGPLAAGIRPAGVVLIALIAGDGFNVQGRVAGR